MGYILLLALGIWLIISLVVGIVGVCFWGIWVILNLVIGIPIISICVLIGIIGVAGYLGYKIFKHLNN